MAEKDKEKKQKDQERVTIEETPRGGEEIGGTIKMSEDVVATIAALGAKQIQGIHALGRSRLISLGKAQTHGVGVEVGSREAALDLDVTIDYGTNIHEVSDALRTRIADEVDRMAGRKVVEVNINVIGIHLPEEETTKPVGRVQ